MRLLRILAIVALSTTSCLAANLTGNWLAATPLPDGTQRKAYFDLKQQDSKITGHIRVTQFYYTLTESTVTSESFTGTRTLQAAKTMRPVIYEGKLLRAELHMPPLRRPDPALPQP